MKKILKKFFKSCLQVIVLPTIYRIFKKKNYNDNLVIFADSNTNSVPESMQLVYDKIKKDSNYTVKEYFLDYSSCGLVAMMKNMFSFMKDYSNARCVIICNYYVPASACNKRKETKLIQLWHSCGLLKKVAYDCKDDIKNKYINPVKNYTLMTVSSQACVTVLENAFRIPNGVVKAIGVSRTDCILDKEYNEKCKKDFYLAYPQAKGKKIALWAPTFRGSANEAYVVGEDAILELEKKLGDEWYVIIKLHPHIKKDLNNCDIDTYQLLPVIDVLITDYSSILFDYALLKKAIVLWAPDYEQYNEDRSFYIDYNEKDIPAIIVKDADKLSDAIKKQYKDNNPTNFDKFNEFHLGACDGKSTDRIIDMV